MVNFNKKKSKKRCNLLRKKILNLSQNVQALHIGGSFSSVELIEVIFFYIKKKKETFILSKGHAGVLLYSMLNMLGNIKNRELIKYCKKEGKLGVHPDYKNFGIAASTGSLGHGPGLAAGISIAEKKNKKIYVLLSDGELQEGSVWEAIIFISSKKLNNIVLIIDNNNLQSSTLTTDTHPTIYPIGSKFKSFGWDVETCNGHNSHSIFKILKKKRNKPLALIAKTIKGYPISFMSNIPKWHYRSPNKKEYEEAIMELDNEK